jgi:REP element-mobilizing transposase RayT
MDHPDLPHRQSHRLRGHDYASAGAYFITICSAQRIHCFGAVHGGQVELSRSGRVVQETWDAMPEHFDYIRLDELVVMPDHIHGILWIRPPSSARPSPASPLGVVVGMFKAASTRRIRDQIGAPTEKIWQRNDHDHLIRDPRGLARIRQYIRQNPTCWSRERDV